jgi:hypothetical protein
MASVAVSDMQMVVVILVKAFTTAPTETHDARRSRLKGGEKERGLKRVQNICTSYLNLMAPTNKGIAVVRKQSVPNPPLCAATLLSATTLCVVIP